MAQTVMVLNTKGGPGKTTTVMALLTWWDAQITVVDVDKRPLLTLTSWLDKAEARGKAPESVTWIKATASELKERLEYIDGTVLVDSAGQVPESETLALAKLADVILVPGASNELEAIAETVKTVRGADIPAPVTVILTKANPQAYKGRIQPSSVLLASSLDVEVIGWVPHYVDIADAPQNGWMLDEVGGRAGERLEKEIRPAITRLKELIGER